MGDGSKEYIERVWRNINRNIRSTGGGTLRPDDRTDCGGITESVPWAR